MKKLFLGLLCMAAALMIPLPALAAELSIEAKVDVKVKYTEEEMQYSTSLNSGEPITLQDGINVTVQAGNDADSDIQAVVVLIMEEDAEVFSYVSDRIEAYGENPYSFYILFYRDGEEVTPSAPVTVTVTVPDGYGAAALYSFTGDDTEVQELSDSAQGGVWTFVLSESCYIAAVLPGEDEPTPTPTPGGDELTPTPTPGDETEPTPTPMPGINGNNSGTGNSTGGSTGSGTAAQGTGVQTGDETNIAFWLFVLASSAVCTAGMILRRKRAA